MTDIKIVHSECLAYLRTIPDNTFDSIVTDPPYGLKFMAKKWDYDVPSTEIWAECLRVLKPGGYLLAFAGTRTQHRMAVRIEDAGFEIRDMIAWVYGCLDEQTEVATANGVMPYHKTKVGDLVLCYNSSDGEYSYQPILEIVEYEYSDTAYRLVGDFGEQVVSRNHRVIVERGGSETFQFAETLECEARIPVLEDLPALQQALHDSHAGAGTAQQGLRSGMCKSADRCCERGVDTAESAQGRDDQVCGMRNEHMEAERMAAQGCDTNVQPQMQWCAARSGMGCARTHGAGELVGRVRSGAEGPHDGRVEPCMERRAYISESEGGVCGSTDKVRSLSRADDSDGEVGRVCDGASPAGGACTRQTANANGVCPSHQPQRDGQPAGEPDVVCDERATQGVRAWGGHRTTLVRVVPFHYTGKVWCLRVPTGAFVAVRNGVAFPTGNSGFPKSVNVGKEIDKHLGVKRDVVGTRNNGASNKAGETIFSDDVYSWSKEIEITIPASEEAEKWDGYGTGLKPAMEPITVARKPLDGTIVANLLKHGTGAINIDGCRIATDEKLNGGAGGLLSHQRDDKEYPEADNGYNPNRLGRWPANLIHDGSDEVLAQFPTTASGKANIKRQSGTEFFGNSGAAYGDESRPAGTEMISYGDKGSAARFFYCAKASPTDRNEGCDDLPAKSAGDMTGGRKEGSAGLNNPRAGAGRTSGGKNFWPTVKPTELMRYLVKLVTPSGGRLLDPFCGSGSTGKACAIDGVDCTLIDMDEEAIMITEARVSQAVGQPIKRDPTVKPPHWDDDLDGEWIPSASQGKPADWDEDLDGPWSPQDHTNDDEL